MSTKFGTEVVAYMLIKAGTEVVTELIIKAGTEVVTEIKPGTIKAEVVTEMHIKAVLKL